ncbi:hypothetical protein EGW08_004260 [Elysia chlorotica]|uniref:Uncharacterized protein n=1 Tax=Elysia chlorotica TaxID=188477 RepID=A0A433U2C7_ELYCH|nr:hypothetical protein EGW08_004260 [Elysia chlorotica]
MDWPTSAPGPLPHGHRLHGPRHEPRQNRRNPETMSPQPAVEYLQHLQNQQHQLQLQQHLVQQQQLHTQQQLRQQQQHFQQLLMQQESQFQQEVRQQEQQLPRMLRGLLDFRFDKIVQVVTREVRKAHMETGSRLDRSTSDNVDRIVQRRLSPELSALRSQGGRAEEVSTSVLARLVGLEQAVDAIARHLGCAGPGKTRQHTGRGAQGATSDTPGQEDTVHAQALTKPWSEPPRSVDRHQTDNERNERGGAVAESDGQVVDKTDTVVTHTGNLETEEGCSQTTEKQEATPEAQVGCKIQDSLDETELKCVHDNSPRAEITGDDTAHQETPDAASEDVVGPHTESGAAPTRMRRPSPKIPAKQKPNYKSRETSKDPKVLPQTTCQYEESKNTCNNVRHNECVEKERQCRNSQVVTETFQDLWQGGCKDQAEHTPSPWAELFSPGWDEDGDRAQAAVSLAQEIPRGAIHVQVDAIELKDLGPKRGNAAPDDGPEVGSERQEQDPEEDKPAEGSSHPCIQYTELGGGRGRYHFDVHVTNLEGEKGGELCSAIYRVGRQRVQGSVCLLASGYLQTWFTMHKTDARGARHGSHGDGDSPTQPGKPDLHRVVSDETGTMSRSNSRPPKATVRAALVDTKGKLPEISIGQVSEVNWNQNVCRLFSRRLGLLSYDKITNAGWVNATSVRFSIEMG